MAKSAYIHIPFCLHKCDFCDFTAFSGLDHLVETYCQTLCKEIEDRLNTLPNNELITTIFYGGGTPGLIKPELINQIHTTLATCCKLGNEAEVTLETTPSTISLEKITQWYQYGINRLSIGVESLQDNELEAIGRGQDASTAITALEIAYNSELKNISCDLMYGLPTQTLESWLITLQTILSFQFPHLSAYGLMTATNSPLLSKFPKDSKAYPDENTTASMYEMLVEKCENAGLNQYEVSNFAKPGYECKHNLACWNNDEYLAFGVGAHRYVDGKRSSNTRSLKQYMRNWLTLETEEVIDTNTQIKEAIFLGLRTRSGINLKMFEERYAINIEERFQANINKLLDGGFLEFNQGQMRLSQKGVLVSNLVLAEFF